jgi:hypothetical protein
MNQAQGYPSKLKTATTTTTTKKTLMALRAQRDSNTVIVGELNTPLSPIDRSSRQKINKEISVLLHTLDQIDVVGIYRVFHTTTR